MAAHTLRFTEEQNGSPLHVLSHGVVVASSIAVNGRIRIGLAEFELGDGGRKHVVSDGCPASYGLIDLSEKGPIVGDVVETGDNGCSNGVVVALEGESSGLRPLRRRNKRLGREQ